MGKSYKQNDRHFQKAGRNFTKSNKSKQKRINFDKIKNIISAKDDLYDDVRGID